MSMSCRHKGLFTFSILLNIVLLGMIGAFYFCAPSFIWHRPGGPAPVAGLSTEARKMVRESFHSAGMEMRDKFREAREAREALVKVLAADTFDEKAYDDASQHMNAVKQDIAAAKARVTRDLAAKLPAADRRKMARNLAGGGKGGAGAWMDEGPKRLQRGGRPGGEASPQDGQAPVNPADTGEQ
jgi:uncharacterized membrane protein